MNTFYFEAGIQLDFGSAARRCNDNLEAIQLLKVIESAGRQATPEEQTILARYVGWGSTDVLYANYSEVVDLTSREELASLEASALNAHYTALPVVQAIWAGLLRLGIGNLSTLRVLDPSAGIGHFRSAMPVELREKSRWVEVELDDLTARILRQLHPDQPGMSRVYSQAFEKSLFPEDWFDLIITNVPFGNYPVVDPSIKDYRLKGCIHDYFFCKALNVLRPGGILAFITSRYTLDKKDSYVRAWLAQRADLLGSVRLPETSFKKNAGTEVVTDMIFLRKRMDLASLPGHTVPDDWMAVGDFDLPGTDAKETTMVNRLYLQHPDWIVGTPAFSGTMYQSDGYTVVYDGPEGAEGESLRAKLLEILPENIVREEETNSPAAGLLPSTANSPAHIIPISDNLSIQSRQQLEGLRMVYDAAKNLLTKEMNAEPDIDIAAARGQLNDVYTQFRLRFGCINRPENVRALKDNPALPFLRALEVEYSPRTNTAKKADIFEHTTIRPVRRPDSAGSAKDALLISLDQCGRVDLAYIQRLTGKSRKEVLDELRGLIYQTPAGALLPADIYLSGNLLEKLKEAEAAAAVDVDFEENVIALRNAMPAPLKPSQIKARLGANWIPAEVIEAFIAYLLPGMSCSVVPLPNLGAWEIENNTRWGLPMHEMTVRWGTKCRWAIDLVDDALNARTPTVYDEVERDKRLLNRTETLAAQAKMEEIKACFETWVWEDAERTERLADIYNARFNVYRRPHYDGSHLSIAGMKETFKMRPYQLDAVWRALQSPTTLFGHEVGLGKTVMVLASVMESKRLGLTHKAMIVVPNHLTGQWHLAAQEVYPLCNVLCASEGDLAKFRRGEFMSRVATLEWDLIIVPFSAFKLMPVGASVMEEFINNEIEALCAYLHELKANDSPRKALKQIEKAIKRYEARLAREAEMRKDAVETVTWEQMGVDLLAVDEFHAYKNLFFPTKMSRIAGLPNGNSERAFDMFVKIRHLLTRGGKLIGATGTPVTNTLAEVYTLQRYYQLEELVKLGLDHFDSWAQMFADTVMLPEMTPDGSSFRINTRLARYTNVPELAAQLAQFCEIRTWEQIGVSELERPRLYGDRAMVVKLPGTQALRDFIRQLAERAEKVRRGKVDPKEDNMLKITGEGRKAALDMRLIDPATTDLSNSKINTAAGVIAQIWKETVPWKASQIVFCDLGTPKAIPNPPAVHDNGEEGGGTELDDSPAFQSVYQDLRMKLMERGIPADEIAFIHDAKKREDRVKLFEAVNQGKVRVLIGSTEKMGTGMNVQRRVVALHHLDAPWRPADIEQREGRMLRPGNAHKEAFGVVYIVEGSFDAYTWQLLETKARFIEQIMTGQVESREVEDVSETVLSMAEIKALASGNPKVIERVTMQNELARLDYLYKAWLNNRQDTERLIRQMRGDLEKAEKRIAGFKSAIARRDGRPADEFQMTLFGRLYTERREAGETINQAAQCVTTEAFQKGRRSLLEIGTYRGFTLQVQAFPPVGYAKFGEVDVLLVFEGYHLVAHVSDTPLGTVQSVNALLRLLDEKLKKDEQQKEYLANQIEALTAGLQSTWEHADSFAQLRAKLAVLDKELSADGIGLEAKTETDTVLVENDASTTTTESPQSQAPATPVDVGNIFDLETVLQCLHGMEATMTTSLATEDAGEVETFTPEAIFTTSLSYSALSWDDWMQRYGQQATARPRRQKKVPEGQLSLF